ncbi:MAG: hypothetical protein IAB81_03240 [Bacteroidetes bacterium]|uniref:Uncharacterized protein n=1 Tax=Candidatus Merdivivens pullicola TaxID=2840872 RepID=A0A9D9IIC0_9BACT|nr:hypothetical protein [Candidatus Merdivivens pullicola]
MKTYVSSKSLIQLQTDLISLSERLQEIYDLLKNNETELGEDWLDEKFVEFEEEFKSSREKITEMSERYNYWANKYLPPIIETVQRYENSGVTLNK